MLSFFRFTLIKYASILPKYAKITFFSDFPQHLLNDVVIYSNLKCASKLVRSVIIY